MTPLMIAIAMDKKRKKSAYSGKDAPAAADAAAMMGRDDEGEDESGKRNCLYLGGALPDLPEGEITATVKGKVVGNGTYKRIEVEEVNGVKLAGEPEAPADDGGAAISDALSKEYGEHDEKEEV